MIKRTGTADAQAELSLQGGLVWNAVLLFIPDLWISKHGNK